MNVLGVGAVEAVTVAVQQAIQRAWTVAGVPAVREVKES
jgi:hypothetical protein